MNLMEPMAPRLWGKGGAIGFFCLILAGLHEAFNKRLFFGPPGQINLVADKRSASGENPTSNLLKAEWFQKCLRVSRRR